MVKVRPLKDEDYAALADFRYALRRFLAFSETEAVEVGLTPQQHQALLAIRAAPKGTATVGLIAQRLVLKPHSATGLVNRLASLDLVVRTSSEEDRRQSILTLTETAERLLLRLTLVHREEIAHMTPLLQHVLEHFGTE